MKPSTGLLQKRQIRVFVSSTFRDMQEERDLLIKKVFPEIKHICRQRGIEFVEVDLRWGITQEQAERGEVLPICLAEIERCRPYFIGLLGERYGWIPENIDEELADEQPWLKEHIEQSVTELEIIHGVLRNPQMANHSFFYFRDPKYIDSIPKDRQKEYFSESPESANKLNILKNRIKKSHFPLLENYANPEELALHILRDLKTAIDKEYPEGSQLSPLDRETADHEAFGESRTKVYMGRKEYFDRLDQHINDKAFPLIVLGESGSGKSALISNWVKYYREKHPGDFLLVHYIGGTADSTNYIKILLRIMGEIKQRYNVQEEIPADPKKLIDVFQNWLDYASSVGKFILILDALNQIEDNDNAPDLIWLPTYLPENTRLIVSTLPGRSLNALRKRKCKEMEVKPLNPDEIEKVVINYLEIYRKKLNQKQVKQILIEKQATNPLFLRVLLDELRVFGIHEELDNLIDYYLKAQSIPELFDKVLQRFEEDYDGKPGLVKEAFSLIWASRRGLSESELLEILGERGKPLPSALWSPLFLASEESLTNRSGLLTFFHSFLRKAVEERYLKTGHVKQEMHHNIAAYFEKQPLSIRKANELPWQFSILNEWSRLHRLMKDLDMLMVIWHSDEYDLKSYWVKLELHTSNKISLTYNNVIESPDHYIKYTPIIARLLSDTGNMKEAQSIWEFLVEFFEKNGNLTQLQDALYSLAWILQSVGARKNATQMMKRMEELAMNFQNERNQAIAIDGQAVLLHQRGISNTGKALELSEKAEALCRKIGDNQLLCVVLGNQALFYLSDGESDKAMTLLDSCEKLARGLNDNDTLMACLDNKSVIMTKEGKFDEALNLLKAQEQLCRKFNNTTLLQSSIGKQAFILTTLRKPEEAQLLWYEQERLCMGLDRIEDLLKCLIDQARNMSYNLDNPREALNICDKALRILYAEERKPEVKMQMLYMSVNIKGVRYEIQNYLLSELMEEASEQMNTGEYKKAYSLYEEAINLSQQLGEKESEQNCFVNMLKLNDKK